MTASALARAASCVSSRQEAHDKLSVRSKRCGDTTSLCRAPGRRKNLCNFVIAVDAMFSRAALRTVISHSTQDSRCPARLVRRSAMDRRRFLCADRAKDTHVYITK